MKVVFETVHHCAEPLKNFSDEQFFHFQLMITLILQGNQKGAFDLASNITFIYPLC